MPCNFLLCNYYYITYVNSSYLEFLEQAADYSKCSMWLQLAKHFLLQTLTSTIVTVIFICYCFCAIDINVQCCNCVIVRHLTMLQDILKNLV